MLTYTGAREFMEGARNPLNGRPLQNNTRLYTLTQGGEVGYGVMLHATYVVTILPGNRYELRTGGWDTVTTWDRIRNWSPLTWRTSFRDDGVLYLRARPNEKDPEPEYPHREIPRPYTVPDPGPEPIKSAEGCKVGKTFARIARKYGYDGDGEFRQRAIIERGEWIEESYAYGRTGVTEQCPHCKDFAQRDMRWRDAYHGGYRQRRGYARMAEMLERYGSREAWHEAYITEFRQVREARKRWREWSERNSIPFYEGVIIDGDGYPLTKLVRAVKKREREEERARRRYLRECERREREEQQLERFKSRMRKRRGERFETRAARVAQTLAELRAGISEPELEESA